MASWTSQTHAHSHNIVNYFTITWTLSDHALLVMGNVPPIIGRQGMIADMGGRVSPFDLLGQRARLLVLSTRIVRIVRHNVPAPLGYDAP
jgi:hypothetical protein